MNSHFQRAALTALTLGGFALSPLKAAESAAPNAVEVFGYRIAMTMMGARGLLDQVDSYAQWLRRTPFTQAEVDSHINAFVSGLYGAAESAKVKALLKPYMKTGTLNGQDLLMAAIKFGSQTKTTKLAPDVVRKAAAILTAWKIPDPNGTNAQGLARFAERLLIFGPEPAAPQPKP